MTSPFFDNIERHDVDIVQGGEGAKLWDDKSQRWLLDFWCDESTMGLGYDITQFIHDFANEHIPHQLPDIFPSSVRTELAQRLLLLYGFDKVFFSNSGAESIETAIKAARHYWWNEGRADKKICYTLSGNFHGRTYGALSLSDSFGSGSPYHKVGFEAIHDVTHAWDGYGVVDEDSIENIDPSTAAALFMAPVLGNNCVKEYGGDYLRQVRQFCTDNDILLVFDEIQTGSGWTGCYSAAQYYGVQPDVMTLGKRIALGFPMSATLMSERLRHAIGLGQHFNTFAGSPFVCYMAGRWLDWLENGGLNTITDSGMYIEDRLRSIPWVNQVNRVGMMCSFLPDYERIGMDGFELCQRALEHGLLIVTHRKDGEIRFTPPCVTPWNQIDLAIYMLKEAGAK